MFKYPIWKILFCLANQKFEASDVWQIMLLCLNKSMYDNTNFDNKNMLTQQILKSTSFEQQTNNCGQPAAAQTTTHTHLKR